MASDPDQFTRRAALAAGATLLGGFAGCGTDSTVSTGSETTGPTDDTEGTESPDEAETRTESADSETQTATADTETDGTTTPDLDLREANVVGVEFEGGDGSYGFDVTLYHDDDGEDGYANWWQVESLAGDRLGRRTLLHAHSTAPFTRSETVDVPAGTTCVVVRGHDQTHGYGGQAMVVNLETGATRAIEQGPDTRAFDEGDCP